MALWAVSLLQQQRRGNRSQARGHNIGEPRIMAESGEGAV
jgi:hypothetical protein